MFWKKDRESATNEVCTLTVKLKDGSTGSWSSKKDGVILPWKDFYKWYFCREVSDDFIVNFIGGCTLIKRDQIITFTIKREEIPV